MDRPNPLVIVLAVAGVVAVGYGLSAPATPTPATPPWWGCPDGRCPVPPYQPEPQPVRPQPQPQPQPCPGPGPCPTPPYRPRLYAGAGQLLRQEALPLQAVATLGYGAFVSGGPEQDGLSIACDLPADRHKKNRGGTDGAGLCVFYSLDMAGDWHNDNGFRGFGDWMARHPGGGWPDKVRQMIEQKCREEGRPVSPYVETTNGDVEVLRRASRNRWMCAATYSGQDGVFYRGKIAHMIDLVYFDDTASKRAAILDNNFPGKILWMTADEFLKRWNGWAITPRRPGPPPVPAAGAAGPVAVADPYEAGGYQWSRDARTPGQWNLYRVAGHGAGPAAQVGAYRPGDDTFMPFDAQTQTWGGAAVPPIPVPREAWPAQVGRGVLTGVVESKVKGGPAYTVDGTPATRQQALAALDAAAGGPPEDRGRLWVTVIGSAEERRPVEDHLARHPHAGKLLVQGYAANDWPVRPGFPTGGHPAVVVQGAADADGRAVPLWAQADGDLAVLDEGIAGALRKADPLFKPDQVPGPNNGPGGETELKGLALVGGAVAVLFLLFHLGTRRRDE